MTPQEIIKFAAAGNGPAESFLRAYYRRAHFLDDIADEKCPTSRNDRATYLANAEAEWLTQLAANPFFVQHAEKLVPLMLAGLNAWVDSESLPDQQAAVVKGVWHELVWFVAFITGGWPRMRELTSQAREYDFEEPVGREPQKEEAANGLVR